LKYSRIDRHGNSIESDLMANTSLDLIEHQYLLPEQESVMRFLYLNPPVAELLIDAYAYLTDTFGPNPQITLQLEYLEEEAEPILFGYIQTPYGVEESLRLLDQFDDEWFLEAGAGLEEKLEFNLAFS
jgi:hypothetical protein